MSVEEIEGLRLTSRMKRVLHATAEEARERGHDFIGTEHVLLGLLDEPDGIAAQVLKQLGLDEEVRRRLGLVFDSVGYDRGAADQELRHELLRRRDADQAPRRRDIRRASIDEMLAIARENAAWLKRVIADHGWPGRRLVGNDGAEAAWLIAQHADDDLEFQRECLRLIEAAVDQGDAPARNAAYLTDRVRIKEGRPQVYGTQFNGPDPFPIEDHKHVDERRAAIGLEPLAEYAKHFAHYPKSPPAG